MERYKMYRALVKDHPRCAEIIAMARQYVHEDGWAYFVNSRGPKILRRVRPSPDFQTMEWSEVWDLLKLEETPASSFHILGVQELAKLRASTEEDRKREEEFEERLAEARRRRIQEAYDAGYKAGRASGYKDGYEAGKAKIRALAGSLGVLLP